MMAAAHARRPPLALAAAWALVAAAPLAAAGCGPSRPTVLVVRASCPGADAREIADTVGAPIQQQILGVEDLDAMAPETDDDGQYTLTLTFRPRTDPDLALALVRNRVALAEPMLPESARRLGVRVEKIPPP